MENGEVLVIGRVLRPWGREGAVLIEPQTHDVERFRRLASVGVRGRGDRIERRVRRAATHTRGHVVLWLEGIDSVEQAEGLRDAQLEVAESACERPAGDAYFHHELLGMEVETEAGEALGRVVELLPTGGTDVLVIRAEGAPDLLLPAARQYLLNVDPESRRLVAAVPEELRSLNAKGERCGSM
jgi:16S rRNA processing protein RimM